MKEWAIFPIRLGLGLVFIMHGLQKAFGLFDGAGIAGFAGMLDNLGFPMGTLLAYVVAYIEFIGGIFLVVGLFSRLTAFALTVVMLFALAKVHLAKGFFSSNGGYEYVLLIIVNLLAIMLFGAGNLGMDPNES